MIEGENPSRTSKPFRPLHKTVQKHGLTFQNVFARCRHIKPDGPIKLREELSPARARRPFHLKHVASELFRVPVALYRPHMHDLAARLSCVTERDEFAAWHVAGFFGELSFDDNVLCI